MQEKGFVGRSILNLGSVINNSFPDLSKEEFMEQLKKVSDAFYKDLESSKPSNV